MLIGLTLLETYRLRQILFVSSSQNLTLDRYMLGMVLLLSTCASKFKMLSLSLQSVFSEQRTALLYKQTMMFTNDRTA